MYQLELICRICGDKARGLNYNVISCMSCKAFFRRNALRPTNTIPCRCKSKYQITKTNRTHCASCRLKKCFRLGMKLELIRSFTQQYLPKLRWMNIYQNNRLTLTSEQWTFISNINHLCNETKFIHQINCLLIQNSSIPIKLRVKQSFICQYIQYAFESISIIMRNSSDFQTLSINTRRIIIQRNIIDVCLVYILLFREQLYLYDSEHVQVDSTVIKIMIFVLMFASNSTTSYILQTNNYDQSNLAIELIRIQNIFVTILWKYLVYQYGYIQTIVRYSLLIKIILDFSSIIEQIQTNLNEILLKIENFDFKKIN